MFKTFSMIAAVAVFFVVGFAADSAQAQGCCKAGLCRIPTLPSTASNSMSMLQPQFDAQMAARTVQPAATNGAARNGVAQNGSATVTHITLSNPAGSRTGVEYVLDGKSYVLEPGMSLTMAASQPRKIEFKRGENGTAKYRVSRGTYEFEQSAQGWQLFRLAAN
jgi:hypothetical protein